MVLKVVRGKILEKLELQRVAAAGGSTLESLENWGQEPFRAIGLGLSAWGAAPLIKLSKILRLSLR